MHFFSKNLKSESCLYDADLLFAVDTSFSVASYFHEITNLISNIMDSFEISSEDTHIGYVINKNGHNQITPLNKYNNTNDLKRDLAAWPTPRGISNVGLLLKNAYQEFLANSRLEFEKILLIFTDGFQRADSHKLSQEYRSKLDAFGVKVS